jgi:transposase
VKKLARIVYDGSHKIGEELARNLIEAAEKSVGAHHSEPYRLLIKYLCEDLASARSIPVLIIASPRIVTLGP